MIDVGLWLVLAFLSFGPWLVRRLRAPNSLAWPAFILGLALLVLLLLDRLHLWLPEPAGEFVAVLLLLAVAARLASDLFPRDRASRP